MGQQSSYEQRKASFARCEALIMQIVHDKPNLTHSQIQDEFKKRYRFLPVIDNKLRHLRKIGWVTSEEKDGRLRWRAT